MSSANPSAALAAPPTVSDYRPSKVHVGMACFLVSEAAFFSTLLVGYAVYIGRDTIGPTPAEVLGLGLAGINTALLLSSSGTIELALAARKRRHNAGFCLLLAVTIALGAGFVIGTAIEWKGLIAQGLTIGRNLFGTTFYTLVGFHALHVTMGVTLMTVVLLCTLARRLPDESPVPHLVSWYWHFVDGVWIFVFTLVYIIGR